ncbi:hypothetical protein [Cesiribacter sp. SM1]|uniref:hypothetical protein n=1 Tax=Cesiribacter sp. SM1 TaxID=2861196 RepID=UPI001CD28025|nr:hypothetical protein [Cesiribacter sp. SM1]
MSLVRQYEVLAKKQLALQEGIELMKQIQIDLNRQMMSANVWGLTAVAANATLIPLNVIINSFELKKANSIYQTLVRQVYDKFASSGTRAEGVAKTSLGILKKVVVEELTRNALKDYIPGVNILIGLAEDSLAFWQALQTVSSGSQEMKMIARNISLKIATANRELLQLGIQRAYIHDRMQEVSRIA